jgi:hypothetical protein
MTTPVRQPHPQRCETCEYFGFHKGCPCFGHVAQNIERHGDYERILSLIKKIGCASHSTSPPAPAQGWIRESFVTLYSNKLFTVGEVCNLIEGHRAEAAAAAREQVLDEATEWLFGQFKQFTNEKYTFGDDWLADWWIERVGYLRTPEGRAELESLRAQQEQP